MESREFSSQDDYQPAEQDIEKLEQESSKENNISVEQEQRQCNFKTGNNIKVCFVSDSTLVINNANDNNSNNSQEVTGIQILPTEVIDDY